MENNMGISQEIETRTTVWPSNLTYEYVSIENEIRILKRYVYSQVHCIIIYNSKIWKQPKCLSVDYCIDDKNMWHTHIYIHTYMYMDINVYILTCLHTHIFVYIYTYIHVYVEIYIHIYTMEYFLAIRKKEIQPFISI